MPHLQPTPCTGAQNRVGSIFFVMNLFAFIAVSAIDLVQPERLVGAVCLGAQPSTYQNSSAPASDASSVTMFLGCWEPNCTEGWSKCGMHV
jgi:hypothetical protein